MDEIEKAFKVITTLISDSTATLYVKAVLIGIIMVLLWWFRRQIFKFLKEAAQAERDRHAAEDSQRIGEENEQANRDATTDQANQDDWAEQERKKDQKP